jgi:Ca2+-binding EF-hand superfamily protein
MPTASRTGKSGAVAAAAGPGKAGGPNAGAKPVLPKKMEEKPRRIGGGFAGGQPRAVADDSVAFRGDGTADERSRTLTKMESPLRSGFIPAVMRDVMVRSPERTDDEDVEEGLRQKSEREYLRRVFLRIWYGADKEKEAQVKSMRGLFVGVRHVTEYLKLIGYKPSPGEVEKLIWEVDDDGDGSLSWKEFEDTHLRLVNHNFDNRSGAYEPRGFFNLIEFSLLDKDGSGDVDASEVIAVFYRRYGKAGAMKKLDMLVDQQALDKTITFTDFLQADNKLRLDARRVMGKNRQKSIEPPTRSVVVQRPV